MPFRLKRHLRTEPTGLLEDDAGLEQAVAGAMDLGPVVLVWAANWR
jgi:hypothetical protein